MASPCGHCFICLTGLKSTAIINVIRRTQKGTATPAPHSEACRAVAPPVPRGGVRKDLVRLGSFPGEYPPMAHEGRGVKWPFTEGDSIVLLIPFLSHFLWIYGAVVCCFCVLSPRGLLFKSVMVLPLQYRQCGCALFILCKTYSFVLLYTTFDVIG